MANLIGIGQLIGYWPVCLFDPSLGEMVKPSLLTSYSVCCEQYPCWRGWGPGTTCADLTSVHWYMFLTKRQGGHSNGDLSQVKSPRPYGSIESDLFWEIISVRKTWHTDSANVKTIRETCAKMWMEIILDENGVCVVRWSRCILFRIIGLRGWDKLYTE